MCVAQLKFIVIYFLLLLHILTYNSEQSSKFQFKNRVIESHIAGNLEVIAEVKHM